MLFVDVVIVLVKSFAVLSDLVKALWEVTIAVVVLEVAVLVIVEKDE